MVTKITSLQHPKVKEFSFLRVDKEARRASESVLIIGEKMVRELACFVPLKALITTESVPEIKAKERFVVSEEVFTKIVGMSGSGGFAAVAPMPSVENLQSVKRLLILDRLADPGNVGTLLRTALALGWDGVVFMDTVDPFNDKVLRASRGALFSLPYTFATSEDVGDLLKGRDVLLADVKGEDVGKAEWKMPLALILSHEGSGPSAWAKKCSRKITIPMHNKVESLNVAISGAILLYEMRG